MNTGNTPDGKWKNGLNLLAYVLWGTSGFVLLILIVAWLFDAFDKPLPLGIPNSAFEPLTMIVAIIVSFAGGLMARWGSTRTPVNTRPPDQQQSLEGKVEARENAKIDQAIGINQGIVNYIVNNYLSWRPFIIMGLLILVGLGILAYYLINPPLEPMPEGTWNLAIAGIAVDDGNGSSTCGEEGEKLSNLLYDELKGVVNNDENHIRGREVGCITGNNETQEEQARKIAEKTNATVVLYGVITPTTTGKASFTPKFYVNTEAKDAAMYGAEILGSGQFGTPVEYTLNVDSGEQNEITQRINALRDFLNGLQHYNAENLEDANTAFHDALGVIGENKETAAVIHEFLAIVNIEQGHYITATTHLSQAHNLWSDYARPYLSKGAILYKYGLKSLGLATTGITDTLESATSGITVTLTDTMNCFTPPEIPLMSGTDYLHLSWRCYDEASLASGTSPTMDMKPKIALSRGNIDLALSISGEDRWISATQAFSDVITAYENMDEQGKKRLRRLTGHAYAKRGFIKHRHNPNAAADDYEKALDLLREAKYPSDKEHIDSYQGTLDAINTVTSTPIVSATMVQSPVLPIDLAMHLAFTPHQGGFGDVTRCRSLESSSDFQAEKPQFFILDSTELYIGKENSYITFCYYGFESDSIVKKQVFSPDGSLVRSLEFGLDSDWDATNYGALPLDIPGTYTVVAETPAGTFTETFDVKEETEELVFPEQPTIFLISRRPPGFLAAEKMGDIDYFLAVSFPANETIDFYFYEACRLPDYEILKEYQVDFLSGAIFVTSMTAQVTENGQAYIQIPDEIVSKVGEDSFVTMIPRSKNTTSIDYDYGVRGGVNGRGIDIELLDECPSEVVKILYDEGWVFPYHTIETDDGFVSVRREPNTTSDEKYSLGPHTEVKCSSQIVSGEYVLDLDSDEWLYCPIPGGFIAKLLLEKDENYETTQDP